LAKVDATVDSKVASTYGVQGYPTIFFFHKGEKIDYKGQRTKEYLVNWLSKKTRDPVVAVDQAGYEKLQSEDKVSIVFHGDIKSTQGQIVSKLAVADDFNSNNFILFSILRRSSWKT
jgi:thioredoxin-like negative regulator of GroEL